MTVLELLGDRAASFQIQLPNVSRHTCNGPDNTTSRACRSYSRGHHTRHRSTVTRAHWITCPCRPWVAGMEPLFDWCLSCNFALRSDRHAVALLCGACRQMANQAKFRRHVHQMSEGVCFHFAHDTAAVDFYRNFADSQFCSHFLV